MGRKGRAVESLKERRSKSVRGGVSGGKTSSSSKGNVNIT